MVSRSNRLASEANIWLALTRADGRPHLTPIWFVWVDEKVWVCTQRNAVKARIVAARPAVSFALEDGNAPVTGEGTARLVDISSAPEHVNATFRQKYDWDISDDHANVLIEVTVSKFVHPGSNKVE